MSRSDASVNRAESGPGVYRKRRVRARRKTVGTDGSETFVIVRPQGVGEVPGRVFQVPNGRGASVAEAADPRAGKRGGGFAGIRSLIGQRGKFGRVVNGLADHHTGRLSGGSKVGARYEPMVQQHRG